TWTVTKPPRRLEEASTTELRARGEYVVRQRQFKMPAKRAAKKEDAEDERPSQNQPENERYLLQIDRQSKRSFKTLEGVRTASLEIKSRFPSLQVSVYDTVVGSRAIVDLSSSVT